MKAKLETEVSYRNESINELEDNMKYIVNYCGSETLMTGKQIKTLNNYPNN